MIQLHVASINRSGASLLTRLLDGHPDVASYPIEFNFPVDTRYFPFVDRLTGTPTHIPEYDPARDTDILRFLGLPEKRPEAVLKWGQEKADPIGVRRNYLEREVYNAVKTDFDYELFVRSLREAGRTAKTVRDVYEARHRAYFAAWDQGRYAGTLGFVATYGSGELYIADLSRYFREFEGSCILTPVRDVHGYVASEKSRYARRYYGSKRFTTIKMPDALVRGFRQYDLEAMVRSWLVSITRIVLLQERYGTEGRFIVYRYEDLVRETERVMREICRRSGLRYEPCLLTPTIGGRPWGGSSHRGRRSGVSADLLGYYPSVLRPDEIERIDRATRPVIEYLHANKEAALDLRSIDRKALYDYDYQKRYCEDPEKWALYSALAFRDRRRVQVGPPPPEAILATLYAAGVFLAHQPRLWRQRLLPGWGRQNYT
ncbi:MAG: hypothetical protein MOGMAGMI_00846 [Candidatus Omnitrophica bacterium]|nr:hypothetical protein [Candidatus Omnitrophota bacterium]